MSNVKTSTEIHPSLCCDLFFFSLNQPLLHLFPVWHWNLFYFARLFVSPLLLILTSVFCWLQVKSLNVILGTRIKIEASTTTLTLLLVKSWIETVKRCWEKAWKGKRCFDDFAENWSIFCMFAYISPLRQLPSYEGWNSPFRILFPTAELWIPCCHGNYEKKKRI